MADKRTFSVLIAWDDNDQEQGEYGTIVRAANHDEAETLARAEMRNCHIENYGEDGVDEYVDSEGQFGGSVIECSPGAIWKAQELEDALRDLLDRHDAASICKARAILAQIDNIGTEG